MTHLEVITSYSTLLARKCTKMIHISKPNSKLIF